jgi:hypothetical protein
MNVVAGDAVAGVMTTQMKDVKDGVVFGVVNETTTN